MLVMIILLNQEYVQNISLSIFFSFNKDCYDVNVVSFHMCSMKHLLQQMHIVKDLLVLSDAVADHLAIMEKNFCILSYLSHTFDRYQPLCWP